MRKANFAERLTQVAAWYGEHFSWLVYVGFASFVVAYAIRTQPGCSALAFYFALPLPLILIGAFFFFIVERETSRRWQIGAALVGFTFFLAVTLGFAEFLLRRRLPPNRFQSHLQEIYSRRNTQGERIHRGRTQVSSYNHFGWRDREHSFGRTDARRWVFIGDSYLEAAVAPTLATVFEQAAATKVPNVEVINLAKAGAAPPEEYQHFFYEWAFDYEPTDIVLFLCAANDFRGLDSSEYRHPGFFVTSEVVEKLKNDTELQSYLPRLAKWARLKRVFSTRQEFLQALGSGELALRQRVYQASLSFGGLNKPGVLPNTREYVERGLGPPLGRLLSFVWENYGYRQAHASGHSGCSLSGEEILKRYQEVYREPVSTRLQGLAKWAAGAACRSEKWEQYLSVLKSYPQYFRDDVVQSGDGAGYWAKSLHVTVDKLLNEPSPTRRPNHRDLQQEGKYEKLFRQMHAYAAARNVRFKIVLIPEAHETDPTFTKYWEPMVRAWRLRGDELEMRTAMAARLPAAGVSTLDLANHPEAMHGAYLIYNGHWSEPGIRRIAHLLVDFLTN